MPKIFNNIGVKASFYTLIINFVLFLFKLISGIIANSNAMISDAIHSLTDVITTIVVIIGLILASKDADIKHPYGHERIESAFAICLSFLLLITGIGIGYIGIKSLFLPSVKLKSPGLLALFAALISIIIKEIMYHYTMHVAKKISSPAMEADAWHHRSDSLSSIGSFIGIYGARLGFKILDPLCSIVICLFILKAALEIFYSSISDMLDTSCDEETNKDIELKIRNLEKDIIIKTLKTRKFGSKFYVDVEIAIDGRKTINETNKIVKKIHDTVENEDELIKHLNINVVPIEEIK